MKKKSIIIVTVFLVLSISVFLGMCIYRKNKINDQQRYKEIIKSVKKSLERNSKITFPIHNDYNCKNYIKGHYTSEGLIRNGYLDKKYMLDIDGKSYCKAVATSYLDDNCVMKYDIGISCKEYKSDNFDKQIYNDSTEWDNFYYN